MGAPASRPGRSEFRFRPLEKPEEFRAAEELQLAVGRQTEEPPVPAGVLRAFQDNGGLVVGAFVDIHLAGCAAGYLGWDGQTLYYYSHVTCVRPEYQNHHVGFRLKAFEREELLRQGLSEIRWAFDPLLSRAAMLGVRLLGGVPDRYLVHHYGRADGGPAGPEETDRLRVVWAIASTRVVARIAGTLPSRGEEERRQRDAAPITETEIGESGLRVPTAVSEPTTLMASIEIPFDLAAQREHSPASVRTWRHATRDAFRAAFDLGYRVDDFAVVTLDHERRSFYHLTKAPTEKATPGPAPALGVPPR